MQNLLTTAIELVALAPLFLVARHIFSLSPVKAETPTVSPQPEPTPAPAPVVEPSSQLAPAISYDSVWVKQEVKQSWLGTVKRYKYGRLKEVVRVADIPATVKVPASVKRYSFRGQPKSCIKVADLERLAS